MVFGRSSKTQTQAGVQLVNNHLKESKEQSKVSFVGRQLRTSSRFAPIGDSNSNSNSSNSDNDYYNEQTTKFIVEPVSGIPKESSSEKNRQYQEMDMLTNKLIGDINYDFDPTKLMYIMTSEEETKERK